MAVNTGNTREYSLDQIFNMSFDKPFQQLAVEAITYNPVTNTLERASYVGQGNAALTLDYDVNGNLTTVSKTIGSTTYTKTLTYTSGNLTDVSAWS